LPTEDSDPKHQEHNNETEGWIIKPQIDEQQSRKEEMRGRKAACPLSTRRPCCSLSARRRGSGGERGEGPMQERRREGGGRRGHRGRGCTMRELGLGLGGLQHIIYDGNTTRAIGSMMEGEKNWVILG
jgi:hypothetical protein